MMITKSPVQKLRPWMYAVLSNGKVSQDGARVRWADVPQAELARAWFEDDLVLAVSGSQLPCDLLRTIRTVVVDNDHLPGEVTTLFHKPHISGSPRARTHARTHATFLQSKRES